MLAEFGGPDPPLRHAGVPDGLVERHLRLEVVHGVGAVQRADGEVLFGELVLCQQGAEDEDGIVASLPGLAVVQFRQVAAPGFADPPLGGLHLGSHGLDGWVLVQRQADSILEGQRGLRPDRQAQQYDYGSLHAFHGSTCVVFV